MRSPSSRTTAAVLLAAALLATSAVASAQTPPRTVRPGAPGQASRTVTPGEVAGRQQPEHTAADVRFMQQMIPHHLQALEMTSLVPERTTREDVRLLARRIEMSQEDEIELMRRWLAERGEEVPDEHAHHRMQAQHGRHGAGAHAPPMHGMLSAEELARLAAARGEEFDRLFLEFMIRHHEGAVAMVAELFATDGAAQATEIFQFAAHVDSDQKIEIERMRSMLQAGPR